MDFDGIDLKKSISNRMFNFLPDIKHSLKYNPSIDGLRGIAIILVLLFHIWPKVFPFGYVGVDVFFVISGFLITQIIYRKLDNGNFSFLEFYRNRIRRIFPSMLIVLSFTAIIGYLFMFPEELKNLGKHIKSSAYFYENFRLLNEVGYWDLNAHFKPLLHFWSLSVEEQFYIFWPFLIFVLYKLRVKILFFLVFFFFSSLILPQIFSLDLFYNSFARFWEISFGGIIYFLSINNRIEYYYEEYISKFSSLILLCFLFAISLFQNETRVNISKLLFLVVITGILLFIYTKKSNRFLSNKLLVFFGLISFPLYLWHYVIISFMYIFNLNVHKYGFLIILISTLLSYITYRFVEVYARRQKSYKFAFILLILVILVGLIGIYFSKSKGLPQRVFLINNKKFEKQFTRTKAKNIEGINLIEKLLENKPINDYIKSTSDNLSSEYILIIGDSHAHTSYPGFSLLARKYGLETLLIANSGCPPYINGVMGKNIKDLRQCERKTDDIYKIINSKLKIKKIIFVTRAAKYMYSIGYGIVDGGDKEFNYYFSEYFKEKKNYNQENIFLQKVKKTFKYFNYKKSDFYYLIENPELGFYPNNCMERPFDIFPSKCRVPLTEYLKRTGELRNFVYQLQKKYKNIKILDPKNLYCDDKYCYAIKKGKMLYADDDHHSIDGSIMMAKYFEDIVFNK